MSKLDQLKALGDAKRAVRSRILPQPEKSVTRKTGVVATESGITTSRRAREDRGEGDGMETPPLNSKRGRGRPKIEGPRPWDAAGISRTSYYRNRRLSEQRSKEQK